MLLLDSLARHYFHIESVTFGDNGQLHKQQIVEYRCQEWTNSDCSPVNLADDKVYIIKVMMQLCCVCNIVLQFY